MKYALALILAFAIGALCRFFGIPAPSPPKLAGALLIFVMTLGYFATDRYLHGKQPPPSPDAEH